MDGVGRAGSIPVLRSFDSKTTWGPTQPTSEYSTRSGMKLSTPIRTDRVIPEPFHTRMEAMRTTITAPLFHSPVTLSHSPKKSRAVGEERRGVHPNRIGAILTGVWIALLSILAQLLLPPLVGGDSIVIHSFVALLQIHT
jgi:hypothetical protein